MRPGIFNRDRWIVSLAAISCLVCTGTALVVAFRELRSRDLSVFRAESGQIRDAVGEQLRAANESLHNIAALFTVSSLDVDSDGFRLIADASLAQQRAVRFLSFARWVPSQEKKEFESQNWRASGLAAFKIQNTRAGSKSGSSKHADNFLPIVFLEPLTPSSISLLGVDLWSDPAFREDAMAAIATGQTVASTTNPDTLVKGFSLVKAVYWGRAFPSTAEMRMKSVWGLLRIFLSTSDMLAGLKGLDGFNVKLKSADFSEQALRASDLRNSLFLRAKLYDRLRINVSAIEFEVEVEKLLPFAWERIAVYVAVLSLGILLTFLISHSISNFLKDQREIRERHSEIEKRVREKTKALRQTEMLLRQVIDSNPNLIFAQSARRRILFANQTFFRVMGRKPAEIYGHAPNFDIPGGKSGSPVAAPFEEVISVPGGKEVWVETTRVPIEIADQGLCFLVVSVDISQKKSAEAVIANQRATMFSTAKLSALGEMAGGVAHEINTPLATIQLLTEQIVRLLASPDPDLCRIQDRLDSIDATTTRIAEIVSGLRSFSRDGSKDPMSRFCLIRAIDETLAFCREKFRNHGVQLVCELPPSLEVIGQRVQISQVILNLLNNAFDAVHGRQLPWIRIHALERDEMVRILVDDNGCGIPEKMKERLFQPFFTTKCPDKGTGLGLSISKGIVDSHSGRLFLDSQVAYTRFIVELPKGTRPEKLNPSLHARGIG